MHKMYKTVLPPQAAAAQGQLASSPAGIPTLDSSAQGIIGLALHFFLMLSEDEKIRYSENRLYDCRY